MPRNPARRASAAALALALGACGRGDSDGPACPHRPASPRLALSRVETVLPAAAIHDESLADLARRGGGEAGRLQGLTIIETEVRPSWRRTVAASRRRGRRCAWLDSLTVRLEASSADIYAPSEYPAGTCERDEILRHEREHEEAHRIALREFAARLREALGKSRRLPTEETPLEVADEAEADRRIEEAVTKAVAPLYEEFRAELAERNRILDLPENYRWSRRRCRAWR